MPASHAKNAILRSSSRRDAGAIGLFWQLEALIEAGHDADTALSLMAKNRAESETEAGQHCRIDTGRVKLTTERLVGEQPIFFTFG